MSAADLANETWWASLWSEIEHWAFLGVVVALAIEFAALKFGAPYKEKIEKAREFSVAEANRKAESERLERLKLEAIVSPRSLSLEKQAEIAASWKPLAGRKVGIVTYAMDGESLVLAGQIVACLRAAGIGVENRIASVMPMGGFVIGINISGEDAQLVSALKTSLSEIGALSIAEGPTFFAGNMSIGPQATGPTIPASAVILIGVKPTQTIR